MGKGEISYSEEEVVPEEFISAARLEAQAGVLAECERERLVSVWAESEGTGRIRFMEN